MRDMNTTEEFVRDINLLIWKEKAGVLGLSVSPPNLVKSEKGIKKLLKLKKYLDKHGYDYASYIRFVVNFYRDSRYFNFPPLHLFLNAKAKRVWEEYNSSSSIEGIRRQFSPTSVNWNGKIFDKESGTYYGFKTEEISEDLHSSFSYFTVRPFLSGEKGVELMTQEHLMLLELTLASALRFREKFSDEIPNMYALWKKAVSTPRYKGKPVKFHMERKKDTVLEID